LKPFAGSGKDLPVPFTLVRRPERIRQKPRPPEVVVKSRGIIRISLGGCSGGSAIKGSECRKKALSPWVIGVPAIVDQILLELSFSSMTICAKVEWNKNENTGSPLDHAR
jgi:hypothetical protein